jgi:hypothetical protein
VNYFDYETTIWDIEKGIVLTIDDDDNITQAYHGLQALGSQEIELLYGSPA